MFWLGPIQIGCYFQLDFFMYLKISFLHDVFLNWSYVDSCIVVNLLFKTRLFLLSAFLESCLLALVFLKIDHQ